MENNVIGENSLKEMFVLNWITNLNSNYAAVNEQDLNNNILRIDDCLKDKDFEEMAGGKWKVVWGPVAGNSSYTRTYEPKKVKKQTIVRWATDNAMYVAQKEGTEEYFIGISGTNGISLKGWFEQDFPVTETNVWPPKCLGIEIPYEKGEAKPIISRASNNGIEALWKLIPQVRAEQEGTRLIDFLLNTMENQECSISVGGHSLGGCLTPLVATAIADVMNDTDSEKYKKVKINAYPTAGPIPGNQAFADRLQAKTNDYHAVFNTNDLVPLSWDFGGLSDLKKNYQNWKGFAGSKINPNSAIVANLLKWASNCAKDQHYVRTPSKISSTFNVTNWTNNKVKGSSKIAAAISATAFILTKNSLSSVQFKRLDTKKLFHLYRMSKLVQFLFQVLLQHVPTYLDPESTNGEVPWEFEPKEREVLGKLFKRAPLLGEKKEITQASLYWAIATSIVLLTDLAELAANWLESPKGMALDAVVEENMGMELDAEEDIQISELEGISSLEELLEESPELAESLPFMSNPYGQV